MLKCNHCGAEMHLNRLGHKCDPYCPRCSKFLSILDEYELFQKIIQNRAIVLSEYEKVELFKTVYLDDIAAEISKME